MISKNKREYSEILMSNINMINKIKQKNIYVKYKYNK